MGERLRTTVARHPGRALGVLAALAVLGTALAAGWTDRLTLFANDDDAPALQVHVRGGRAAKSPAYRVAVRTMRTQISVDPAVASVRERKAAGASVLVVAFEVGGRKRDAAIVRIERNLDPGPLRIDFRGPAAAVRIAKQQALDDLYLLLIALPVIALIAASVLGARGAAMALLAAAAAAALAALACELLAGAVEVSWLALPGSLTAATLTALALCALTSAGAQPAALWATGGGVAIGFAATPLLGVDYLAGLGLGGALGAILAVPAATVAGVAALVIDPSAGRARLIGLWRGLASLVGWSPLLATGVALFGLLALLVVAGPLTRLQTAALGASSAPPIDAAELALAAAVLAAGTVALATAIGRRFWLAGLATFAFATPALATAGLLVVSFQDGGLEQLLGYSSNGAIQLGSAAAALATVAAVGSAQAIALAWASRETEGRPPGPERVAEALASCAPAVACACLAGIAAGVALCFGPALFEKQFGFGLAVGLSLQLVVAQGLLAPALLRVTYRTPDQ